MQIEEKILYDYMNGELIYKNKNVKFSYNENEIMKILVENRDCFVDAKKITEVVYGKDWMLYCYSNIPTYIHRIRKKIKGIMQIDTRKGYGYKIRKITEEEHRRKGQMIYEI